MIKYNPNPIETSTIVLSDDLLKLQDKLAENVHENWAKLRIAEGWAWGRYRDDAAKKHPNLVTYQELPESEKAYDRKVAIETIKAIIALGYRIAKI